MEFFEGIILGATALSSIPFLTQYLGIPYELAWSCVILETFLYMLHAHLGDPVIPGWITAALPLTLSYLVGFPMGPERIQAMIALQLLVGLVFIFMGISKLSETFIKHIPPSLKAGILLATPITVIRGQLADDGQFKMYPVAVTIGFCALAVISFAPFYKKLQKKYRVFDIIAKYGNLFPYLIAMAIGVLVNELAHPQFNFNPVIKLPDFKEIIGTISIFHVGLPPVHMFLKALPLALICYVIAFGDFVTTETLVKEAAESRKEDKIDFNSSRSNIISGIRNVILGLFVPFPPLCGPLWAGMTVSTTIRYAEGKEAMDSLIGGMASFRLGSFISVILVPIVMFMKPVFPVGAAITLLFQAFVCARIGMDYCRNDLDKSIGAIMAAVLAFNGAAAGIVVGIFLNLILTNVLSGKKAEPVVCTNPDDSGE